MYFSNQPLLRRSFFLFAFALSSIVTLAQDVNSYVFTHFKRKDGLASDRVFAITQDKNGFMWIGMDNGLQRYDGHRFITIRSNPSDKKSLPDDIVTLLHSDKKGRLWLAAGKKIGMLNRATHQFIEVPVEVSSEDINSGFNKFFRG